MTDAARAARTAAAITVATLFLVGVGAGAPTAGADGSTSLAVRAQEIAGQIAADGRRIDELDAAYLAAEQRLGTIQSHQAALQSRMAATAALVSRARAEVKEQALLAYLAAGGPIVGFVPGKAGQDPSLTASYAEIVTNSQKRDADAYRQALAEQAATLGALAASRSQAATVLESLTTDRADASAALAQDEAIQAQVKGQLASAVAAVQQQHEQLTAASVKADLAATGQLPPATPPPAPPTTATPVAEVTRNVAPSTTVRSTTTTVVRTTITDPPTTLAVTPSTTVPQYSSPQPQAPGASKVIAYARAQLGKPYVFGAAGPDGFDCSGLVMMAWSQAGISFPHLAQDQYNLTQRIPFSDILPGDLVFFGTPSNVYHVGIYIGGGDMIDAPETGQNVSVQSIYWSDLLAAGRVTTSS